MKKSKSLIILGIFSLILAACSYVDEPQLKTGSSPEALRAEFVTYDDLLVQVSEHLPGFGGMFFDELNQLNVYLLDAASPGSKQHALQVSQAKEAITTVFGEQLFEDGAGPIRNEDGVVESQAVKIALLEAQYEVADLSTWRKNARDILTLPGTIFTDLDEQINRIAIGIEASVSQEKIKQALREKGIPLEAVEILIDEPVERGQSQTVQDDVEDNMGGIQISTSNGSCTLGFIADSPVRGRGFVTNSHCTNVQGGTEQSLFYQPSTPYLGWETFDPTYFTNIQNPWSACPTGRQCRYSDSAFGNVAASASSALGDIARPLSWNQGNLAINDSNPILNITAEYSWPTVGQYFDKVGRTTGWTYGKVDRSCYDVNQNNTNFTMICQYRVSRTSGTHTMTGPGDSGSPVFYWRGNNVDLAGVNWSACQNCIVFSALPTLEWELGALTTF